VLSLPMTLVPGVAMALISRRGRGPVIAAAVALPAGTVGVLLLVSDVWTGAVALVTLPSGAATGVRPGLSASRRGVS
jgi:hypothetical protein